MTELNSDINNYLNETAFQKIFYGLVLLTLNKTKGFLIQENNSMIHQHIFVYELYRGKSHLVVFLHSYLDSMFLGTNYLNRSFFCVCLSIPIASNNVVSQSGTERNGQHFVHKSLIQNKFTFLKVAQNLWVTPRKSRITSSLTTRLAEREHPVAETTITFFCKIATKFTKRS